MKTLTLPLASTPIANMGGRATYWHLPGTLAAAKALPPVTIPPGARFLYLDPRLTTPTVILGVSIPASEAEIILMSPGDAIPLPSGTMQVHVYAPIAQFWADAGLDHDNLIGFVCLRAMDEWDYAAVRKSVDRIRPYSSVATVIVDGITEAGLLVGSLTRPFPTINLTGLRIFALPLQNDLIRQDRALLTTHSVTLRPLVGYHSMLADGFPTITLAGSYGLPPPGMRAIPYELSGNVVDPAAAMLAPNAGNDLIFDVTTMVQEYPVDCGSLWARFEIAAVAADAARQGLAIVIEGY